MPSKHVLPSSLDSSSSPTYSPLTPGQGVQAPGTGRVWHRAALMDTVPASGPPCWDFILGKAREEAPQLPAVISCLLPKASEKQLPEIPWAQRIALGLPSSEGDAFICEVA